MIRRLSFPAALLLGLLLVVSGAWADPAPAQSNVQAMDNLFQPQSITVSVGTTVVWTNAGKNPHTVTADDQSWNSDRLDPGQTFSQTFNTPGTFGYFCQFHGAPGSGMFGTVIVTGGAPAAAPTQAPAAPPAAQPTAAAAGAAAPSGGPSVQVPAVQMPSGGK